MGVVLFHWEFRLVSECVSIASFSDLIRTKLMLIIYVLGSVGVIEHSQELISNYHLFMLQCIMYECRQLLFASVHACIRAALVRESSKVTEHSR